MNSLKGKNRFPICCALVFAFAFYGWMGVGSTFAADDSLTCTDCHVDQQEAEYAHSPVQEGFCEACHEAEPKHLEEGGPGGMETDRTAAACYQCHEAKDEGQNIHPALMMEEECIQCHNPHGSDIEDLLVLPKSRLCLDCHDPVPSGVTEGSDHSVVTDGESCVNCHDPHSSDQNSLLISTQRSLCLGCHDSEIPTTEDDPVQNIQQKMDMPFQHEPATWDEGCTSCHAPHGSKYQDLLIGAFPTGNYTKYEAGNGEPNTFELCFTCHDEAMLDEKITEDATNFRNDIVRGGEVIRENLHWLHVDNTAGVGSKNRGRSCNICHDPHGTLQPHLLRSWWTMRSWRPVLEFENRPNGGECLRSCHSPKSYQRIE